MRNDTIVFSDRLRLRRRAARVLQAALALAALHGGIALAACASPVNPDATEPALRSQVAGTWYSENQNPQLGMVQRMYQTFLPTGVFEYKDQTCSTNIPNVPCSQNGGHGTWNATRQGDGSIYIRIQFSDLKRTNDCTGWAAMFPDPNTMAMSNGGRAKRVK